MSFHQLSAEIWLEILEYLAPVAPKPLSGLCVQEAVLEPAKFVQQLPDASAAKAKRSDLKADALSKLMRTSIAFNHLAANLLYSTVLCDSLTLLLVRVGSSSAHPHIVSKAELLSKTRKLNLEYGPKGQEPTQSTYALVMVDPDCWSMVGSGHTRESVETEAIQEIADLLDALRVAQFLSFVTGTGSLGSATPFPNLAQLSIGAVFGGQDAVWDAVVPQTTNMLGKSYIRGGRSQKVRGAIDNCQAMIQSTFGPCPLTHYCQRGHNGPLSLPPAFEWPTIPPITESSAQTSPIFTMHYKAHSFNERMPAAIGDPTRWILDYPQLPADYFPNLTAVVHQSLHLTQLSRSYLLSKRHPNSPNSPKSPTLDISNYGTPVYGLLTPPRRAGRSRLQYKSGFQETNLVGMNRLFAMRQDEAIRLGRPVDKVVWKSSGESPACGACGWCLEEA